MHADRTNRTMMLVFALLLIAEVIADRTSHHPAVVHWRSAYNWAEHTTWNAGSIRVICGILIVAGLVLLIAELKPARVSRLPADPSEAGADAIDTAYTRRGLAAAIRSAVTAVDGVRSTSVKVKRRKVKVDATASAQDRTAARGLREPITDAVRQRLSALKLRRTLSVSVRVAPRSR